MAKYAIAPLSGAFTITGILGFAELLQADRDAHHQHLVAELGLLAALVGVDVEQRVQGLDRETEATGVHLQIRGGLHGVRGADRDEVFSVNRF